VGLNRHKPLLITDLRPRTFGNTEHHPLAWPVDVRIQDPHPRAFTRQCQRKVGGSGGFTDPTLARGNGDDVFHIGQARNLRLRLVRGNHAADLDLCRGHAIHVFNGHLQHLRPTALEQTGGITQLKLNTDALALNLNGAHAPGTDRILVHVRVGVLAKDGLHRCAIDCAHEQLP